MPCLSLGESVLAASVTVALDSCSGWRYRTACAYHLPVVPGTRNPIGYRQPDFNEDFNAELCSCTGQTWCHDKDGSDKHVHARRVFTTVVDDPSFMGQLIGSSLLASSAPDDRL